MKKSKKVILSGLSNDSIIHLEAGVALEVVILMLVLGAEVG